MHNLAGDASLQKLDGLDTSLFSRAPPKARPRPSGPEAWAAL